TGEIASPLTDTAGGAFGRAVSNADVRTGGGCSAFGTRGGGTRGDTELVVTVGWGIAVIFCSAWASPVERTKAPTDKVRITTKVRTLRLGRASTTRWLAFL